MDNYENAKKEYDNYIYLCNQLFKKDSSWWFTPSSSRERFGTDVQDRYVGIIKNLKGFEKKKLSESKTFYHNVHSGKLAIYKEFLNFVRLALILLYHSIRNIWFVALISRKDFDFAFIRPLHPLKANFDINNVFDHYFGELPSVLIGYNAKVAILGPADPGIVWKSNICNRENLEIANLFKYFSFGSYLKWIINVIYEYFNELKLPSSYSPYTEILSQLILREFRESFLKRIWSFAYYLSFTNFLKLNKKTFVIHTYENNSWERAIDRACQENSSKVKKNVGFIHCSILESHRKYALFRDEWHLKPSPEEIIVTGPNARDILLKHDGYERSTIKVGYDLRGPNLLNIKNRNGQNEKINSILILLEGLNTMPKLLELAMTTILNTSDKQVYVRCHPVYPISNSSFTSVRKHPLFQKVIVSENRSLEEDLLQADLVIYKGSTSALYAGFMGIPLLRFKDDWWFSDDPLKYCSALKKEFYDSNSLLDGISFFEKMNPQEYVSQKEMLREYIYQYMMPYKTEELRKFAVNYLLSG
ncbi:hypothetical protein [Leptospira noguchii]|uniref:Uncharacterized protein n=1 Tax=Leptospira noguchii serovar Panama str. CZ214 TaxID=1001595 RepID=T0FJI2_9LEPT|nr:hypothetical protein [Leptospira noguchii]EQA69735.1 hypothetical protein LEP1GSC059_1895 [Leptospira noguchii serovar Panama str. CZ214]